jgi:hypothetical protein
MPLIVTESEMSSLLKALDGLLALADSYRSEAKEYTEVSYRSESGLEIGFFQKGKDQTGFIKSRNFNTSCFFSVAKDLPTLKKYIQIADDSARNP